jgi:hypothetical protein
MIGSIRTLPAKFWVRLPIISKGECNMNAAQKRLSRFKYLNLQGLTDLRGFKISLYRSASPYDYVFSFKAPVFMKGYGSISFNRNEMGGLNCVELTPCLPAKAKLGMSLFSLIVLRGNAFLGKPLVIESATKPSQCMVKYMKMFDPRLKPVLDIKDKSHDYDVKLHIPLLSDLEVLAIEWFWQRYLPLKVFY